MTRDDSALELTVAIGEELSASCLERGWAWVTDAQGRTGWVPLDCLELS